MLKKILLLIILASPIGLLAQNALTGNIFDNDSRSLVIEGATIKNITTNAVTLSDKDGHFVIAAKVGDLVSFGFSGYHTDTVYLVKLLPKNVYLRAKVKTLNTVDVTSTKLSPYLNLKNTAAKPVTAVEYDKNRGGIRFNLGFGKYKKDQARIKILMEEEKYLAEIRENFNEKTVNEAVKFEGEGIRKFLDLFRPTIDQVKADSPFNYTFYIVNAYQSWLKLPLNQRKSPFLINKKTENN